MRRKKQLPFPVAGSQHLSGEAAARRQTGLRQNTPGLLGCSLCNVTDTRAPQQGPDMGIPATFLSQSPYVLAATKPLKQHVFPRNGSGDQGSWNPQVFWQ